MRPVNTFLADSRASLERAGRRQQQFTTGSFYSLQSTVSSDTDHELWSVQGDTAEPGAGDQGAEEEGSLARTRSLQDRRRKFSQKASSFHFESDSDQMTIEFVSVK